MPDKPLLRLELIRKDNGELHAMADYDQNDTAMITSIMLNLANWLAGQAVGPLAFNKLDRSQANLTTTEGDLEIGPQASQTAPNGHDKPIAVSLAQ